MKIESREKMMFENKERKKDSEFKRKMLNDEKNGAKFMRVL